MSAQPVTPREAQLELRIILLNEHLSVARAKSSRQRRELRRLNAYMRPYWSGFRAAIKREPYSQLRRALAEKFGWEQLQAAEREYLQRQQERDDG